METVSALLAICAGNPPVNGEFPAQRPVTRSFDVFFICAWINGWVNNPEAGDLRLNHAHYGVTVMTGHKFWLDILHTYSSSLTLVRWSGNMFGFLECTAGVWRHMDSLWHRNRFYISGPLWRELAGRSGFLSQMVSGVAVRWLLWCQPVQAV